MTFEQYVAQLAAAPDDRGFHAVFADWLLERADSRGEALSLELHGDTRRLEKLRLQHERAWLGPLADLVEPARCAFYGGFPIKLAFKRGAPPDAFSKLPLTLRHLVADWRALGAAAQLPVELQVLELVVGLGMAFSDFRALAAELDLVAKHRAPQLHLLLDTFIGVEAAEFLAAGFLRSALAEQKHVTLLVRDGSLDAACAWLFQAPQWGGGDVWGVRWGGAELQLRRDEQGRFSHVFLDLAFDDDRAIAARTASAATILSQLRRLEPTRLEAHYREGQRVGKRLLDTLHAPRRFLPSLAKVRVTRKKS